MSISTAAPAPCGACDLVGQVVQKAREHGLDQVRLAEAAGLTPETISRAKKRRNADLQTLQALAEVVGLQVGLQPGGGSAASAQSLPTSAVQMQVQVQERSPLHEAKWGLAWSNPGVSTEVLVRNALLKGGYMVLLEAALAHGTRVMHEQWGILLRDADTAITARRRTEVDRQLRHIEQGLRDAQA